MSYTKKKNSKEQVKSLIYSICEAGKNRDFAFLSRIHSDNEKYSKFNDNLPLRRLSSKEASMHEEVALANITDYSYDIESLKIDIFGDIAVTTFYLKYSGMFVNNYTFEGKPIETKSRVTMVFEKRDSGWLIVHEHRSRFTEE